MTTGLHAPPTLLTIVLFVALSLAAALAAWRWRWTLLISLPWLYLWARSIVIRNAYPEPELVWFLRIAVLFPLVGFLLRRVARRAAA